MTRKYPLSKTGLDAATERLRVYLRENRQREWHATQLARDVLVKYFEARHADEVKGRNWSQTTWLLANMVVGQQQHFAGSSLQLIRQRFPFARNLAGDQRMVWRCRSLDSGEIQVTRLPDGTSLKRDPLNNPKVAELVQMQVGELIISSTIKSTRGAGALGSNCKVMARRYLNQLDAQWIVFREHGMIHVRRTK